MALKQSTMLPLGTSLPAFDLPDVRTGESVDAGSCAGEGATLIMFICCHCPYVIHVQEELSQLGKDYLGRGVGIVAISSNDVEKYPQDRPVRLKEMAEKLGFGFPYCFDETQEVAKVFTAACTPDFFLFDRDRKLVYRGQLDDSRPGNGKPVTGKDLRGALEALLAGQEMPERQTPSAGCNIKWRPGNEPAYA